MERTERMAILSHRRQGLSILLPAIAGLMALAGGATAGQSAARQNLYVGRWTVSDDKPVFSSRGLAYKTVDIASCGRDFCGVSVDPQGRCGPVMFRFLAKSIRGKEFLRGHGRWGDMRKTIEISGYAGKDIPGGRGLELNLGDGHDFGSREGSMPKFSAGYRPLGTPRCTAR